MKPKVCRAPLDLAVLDTIQDGAAQLLEKTPQIGSVNPDRSHRTSMAIRPKRDN